MSDPDPSVEAWRKATSALLNFMRAMREAIAEDHTPRGHAVISDELTACCLGARKRPELEGDFDDPTE